MALTYTNVRQRVLENKRTVEADVAFDDSYPTGGEAVSLADIGLSRVEAVESVFRVYPDGATSDRTNHGAQVVPVVTDVYAPLLKVYTSASTEAANESDQSGVIERLRFVGA